MAWVREVDVRGPQGPGGTITAASITAEGVIVGIPTGYVGSSSRDRLPIAWTQRAFASPYPSVHVPTYAGSWSTSGRYGKDVPLLRNDTGRLFDDVIPTDIARKSDIPTVAPTPVLTLPSRPPSLNVPILGARVAKARAEDEALALVFVGSSTTAISPGFVSPLTPLMQEMYRVEPQTPALFNPDAQFTARTTPGIHMYSAGHSNTQAQSYLTDAECDRIAALNPGLIQHMVGSNDFRVGKNPDVYRTQLLARLAYLDSVLTQPAQHVLVHQYERMDGTVGDYPWLAFRDVLEDIASARSNTVFFDISIGYALTGIPTTDPLDLISTDNIHQTPRGYRYMADQFAAFYVA